MLFIIIAAAVVAGVLAFLIAVVALGLAVSSRNVATGSKPVSVIQSK